MVELSLGNKRERNQTMNEKKNKHMTLKERTEIQDCLYKRMTFKAIASLIEKDPTTISKEVKLNTTDDITGITTNTKKTSIKGANISHCDSVSVFIRFLSPLFILFPPNCIL